jgi:hypothetical protein
LEGAGGSRGIIYKVAGHLGVRAREGRCGGNLGEVSGLAVPTARGCERREKALTRGPGRSVAGRTRCAAELG